ncbi:hypothetical protein [Burkholderia sp. BDU5]|uniref:hypothetical protein n=1 Tax=Burkholderia sp. BDU5 TaxID=1385590 RepID=UPI0012E389F8|nr:hypothetical protein [Burkholderia sp. BDU5]
MSFDTNASRKNARDDLNEMNKQNSKPAELQKKNDARRKPGARAALLDNDNIVYALHVGHELKLFPQPCKRDAK